jgi:flagellar biosynthetic protein FliP
MKTFVQHYVEMVVAMFAGMFVYMQVKMAFAGAAPMAEHGAAMAGNHMAASNVASVWDRVGSISMMELSMIVPMVLWMRFRGHSWRHGGEMSLAMVLPSVPFYAIDIAWPGTFGSMLSIWSHLAMCVGMLALMIVQRDMYMGKGHIAKDHVSGVGVTVAH